MEALDSTADPASQDHVTQALSNILQAAQAIADGYGLDGAADWSTPKALSMLADTALSEPMPTAHLPRMEQAMSPASRHIHPSSNVPPQPSSLGPGHGHSHGPTDPRSFILPRPTPTQQPRRLLPARGQLGLPDPFSMNGPPQLPPPPGSHFQRLPPLPNYFPGPPGPPGPPAPGHPGPGQGAAPGSTQAPGPGPGPGQGPGSIYFPSPHHSPHGGPPPPPPRRY